MLIYVVIGVAVLMAIIVILTENFCGSEETYCENCWANEDDPDCLCNKDEEI